MSEDIDNGKSYVNLPCGHGQSINNTKHMNENIKICNDSTEISFY